MHRQVIYYGAPGTGKSFKVDQLLADVPMDHKFRVTIHPEYTYSDFVGQLLPQESPDSSGVSFPFVNGPFTDALICAFQDTNKDVVLILEELSRGNSAAIFGDLFQLLDRNEEFESRYPIRNKYIASKIDAIPDDMVRLPGNFSIVGTVNVNDQNVFPMDTAFKRRFEWEYVSTRPVEDASGRVIREKNNPRILVSQDSEKVISTTWQSFYMSLNAFITNGDEGLGLSEDKQIGQFFIEFGDQTIKDSYSEDPPTREKALGKVNQAIRNKLLMYLWQDIDNGSSFGSSARKLFIPRISSFDELYLAYGKEQIFSDAFIGSFLSVMKDQYQYAEA